MKPLVAPPDGERLVIDYLKAQLAARGEACTVGVALPRNWSKGTSDPHVNVASDGTPTGQWPILFNTVIRATAWSGSSTTSKDLAGLCMGLLLAHPGQPGWDGCRFGTGVLPATDPETKADLASVTVLAKLRGQLL